MLQQKVQVALVDDHVMVRQSMADMIKRFPNVEVLFQADNGKQLIEFLKKHIIPDIILLDLDMPVMDGFEAGMWVHVHYPQIKLIIVTMRDDDNSIVRCMRFGAKSYLTKNSHASVLQEAIEKVVVEGVYMPADINLKLMNGMVIQQGEPKKVSELKPFQREFLSYVCTDLSYAEIAQKLFVSSRTLDTWRAVLYKELKTNSRAGLAVYALQNGIKKMQI
jgi:two-component system, NarL family, invasion response regulator UvrY